MRVLIAEDQVLLREGLGRLFSDAGHEIVASVGDADRVLELADELRPDLVVVDVRMPPTFTDEGARVARELKHQHPELGVLVLSQHVENTALRQPCHPRWLRVPVEGSSLAGR